MTAEIAAEGIRIITGEDRVGEDDEVVVDEAEDMVDMVEVAVEDTEGIKGIIVIVEEIGHLIVIVVIR